MAQKFVVYKEEKRQEGAQFIGVTTKTRKDFIQRFTAFFTDSKKAISHKDGTIKMTDGKTTIESFPLDAFKPLEDLDLPE